MMSLSSKLRKYTYSTNYDNIDTSDTTMFIKFEIVILQYHYNSLY